MCRGPRDTDLQKMDGINGINVLKRNSPFLNGNPAITENGQNRRSQCFET